MKADFAVVCSLILTWILWILVIAAASIAINKYASFNAFESTGTSELLSLYDMGRDWEKQTFTKLMVTDKSSCEPGWDVVYERVFYGLKVGCDCLGKYDRWIKTDNEFVLDVACDRNQTRAGCRTADPLHPVRMK